MIRKAIALIAGFGIGSFALTTGSYTSAIHILPYKAKSGAKAYYAAPAGKTSAQGTLADPYDLVTGLGKLTAGDTLYVRGGTYARTTTLSVDGESGNATSGHTHVFAYGQEKPVLDFTGMATADANRGLQLNGSYWYFKGFEVKNAGDNGILITGKYNMLEGFVIHGNKDTGLQIARKASSMTTMDQWPAFNLVKNSESYDNSDVLGENADGFAAKLTIGQGNAFVGCVSHHNSDDGWDLYSKTETGVIGTVTIDQCVAHHNGSLTDGTQLENGDRNGFKLGGSDMAVRHIVTRSVAFANGKNGFTWNSNPGNIILVNNLAFNNAEGNYKFGDNSTATETEYYNNISLWTSITADVADKYIGTDVNNSNVWWNSAKKEGQTSINGKGLQAYTDDFAQNLANLTGVTRLANGDIDFSVFALAKGSDLIDAGTAASPLAPFTAASAYSGTPDLGPVEYRTTSSSSSSAPSSSSSVPSSSSSITSSSSSSSVKSSSSMASSSSAVSSSSATASSSSANSSSSETTALWNSSTQGSLHYDALSGWLESPRAGYVEITLLDARGNRIARHTQYVHAGSNALNLRIPGRGFFWMSLRLSGQAAVVQSIAIH